MRVCVRVCVRACDREKQRRNRGGRDERIRECEKEEESGRGNMCGVCVLERDSFMKKSAIFKDLFSKLMLHKIYLKRISHRRKKTEKKTFLNFIKKEKKTI